MRGRSSPSRGTSASRATASRSRATAQSAVTPEYDAPFAFTGGTVDKVVMDVSGEPFVNHEAQVMTWFGID